MIRLSYKVLSVRRKLTVIDESNIIQHMMQEVDCEEFKDNERGLLQAISAAFGIDSPNDDEREEIVRKEIIPLFLHPENHDKLEKLIDILPVYEAWTASGDHRFMPLAMAVQNMLRSKNIFSLEEAPEALKDYMSNDYPLYANPHEVREKYVPVYTPHLSISIPKRKSYLWVDIGSAPKTGGAPTLNILRNVLPASFEYYGVDTALPYYEIRDGEIVESVYVKDGEFRDETVVNGVTYLNGRKPEYSVYSDDFLSHKRYDFISICMTLHHLTQDQTYERLPFTTCNIVTPEGGSFVEDSVILTTKSQQEIVDRLLSSLEVGGVLFLDPHTYHQHEDFMDDMLNENITDIFYVIQRVGENEFVIYHNTPIIYFPNRAVYCPSKDMEFIEGDNTSRPFYNHPGLRNVLNINDERKIEILYQLFYRADLLAIRYQSWKKGVWGSVQAVVNAVNEGKTLIEIVEIYLRNIPDDCPDAELKRQLLEDVSSFFGPE